MLTFRFHTNVNGRTFAETVKARNVTEALAILRASLRDGETVIGWAS